MKTLREEWSDFFSQEIRLLSANYPGISLKRFLLEVGDILKLRTHLLLDLEQASFSVSPLVTKGLMAQLMQGIPFAYLTQHCEFYTQSFYINEDVLIPRSETELLVDKLVQLGRKHSFRRALDVGTGSGVIILSLLGQAVVESGVGVDISEAALRVAQINAQRLRLEKKGQFLLSDRLNKVTGKFDLIVSNPPYIKSRAHRQLVHQKVDEFEPASALYLPDGSYEEWFRDFFEQVSSHLTPGGLFCMEGHELELQKQGELLRELNFKDVEVLQDYAGLNRFLMAKTATSS